MCINTGEDIIELFFVKKFFFFFFYIFTCFLNRYKIYGNKKWSEKYTPSRMKYKGKNCAKD